MSNTKFETEIQKPKEKRSLIRSLDKSLTEHDKEFLANMRNIEDGQGKEEDFTRAFKFIDKVKTYLDYSIMDTLMFRIEVQLYLLMK